MYQGTTYRANTNPTAGVVPLGSAQWDICAQAGLSGSNGTSGVSFTYQGAWVSGTPYTVGQWVTYNGNLYYCNGSISNLAALPPNDAGWNLGLTGGSGAAGMTPGQAPYGSLKTAGYTFTVGAGSPSNSTTVSVNSVMVPSILLTSF